MSFAKTHSVQSVLLKAEIVDVEVDISRGLYAFSIVGLPDKAVEESKDRVSASIKNSGFESPKQKNHKVVVSLAPADIKKEGPVFDLSIAISYLIANNEIKFDSTKKIFIGELSLDGKLRPVKGVLPTETQIKFSEIFEIDFCDIKGQHGAKRSLEIAGAGNHNIAMWGPAGTGKTLLAKAFPSILPPLSFDEMLEVTSIHSIAGGLNGALITTPPFRNPHHTSSYVSIVGGGAIPKPGEATLSHRGVLFLDEFPEFDRRVIDTLREPLEEKAIRIARARGSAKFPANFILLAALNPCPCGNWGSKTKTCKCPPIAIEKYKRKISGPIVDRIDLWTEVSAVDHSALGENKKSGEESSKIRRRITKAREMQAERFKNEISFKTNGEIGAKHINSLIPIGKEVKEILDNASKILDLSARSYHKLIKISRTIADLEESAEIKKHHMEEAIQYRPKNFKYD